MIIQSFESNNEEILFFLSRDENANSSNAKIIHNEGLNIEMTVPKANTQIKQVGTTRNTEQIIRKSTRT
jgi:hypothetical protein